MGKKLTQRQRDAIRVSIEFVQSKDLRKLLCMPAGEHLDSDMKLVLQYAVIKMGKMRIAHSYEQEMYKWAIFYWNDMEEAVKYLKLATNRGYNG